MTTKRKTTPARRIELDILNIEELMPNIPDDITFTFKAPGLEAALAKVIEIASAAAMAEMQRAANRADDPLEAERFNLDAARHTLDADRQKLAWEEFKLRRDEFDANERDRAERRAAEKARAARPAL
jgi:hypothetical protein